MDDVTVIIPAYNTEKYIEECVESVLDQTYSPIEVIAVNDGSTDSTGEILSGFADRIQVIHQENQGTGAAINTGIKASTGSLIAWLGSDDAYMPDIIKRSVREFQNRPETYITFSDYVVIDADGEIQHEVNVKTPPHEAYARSIMVSNFINAATVVMRRSCLDEVGLYDESLGADQDGDMWLRLIKAGHHFTHIYRTLLKYRRHGKNTSCNGALMQSCKDQVRMRGLEMFTAEELFGTGAISSGYAQLSQRLLLGYNFQSARLALVKGMELNG